MRVVVLGGGYAGVVLTDRLEQRLPADVDLVVVDDTGDHLVQHELHRAIRHPEFAADVVVPLDDIFDRARVEVTTVERVDRDVRQVELADGTSLDYDVAAVCLGAETAYYGLPGVESHASPLKRLPDAARIRHEFENLVESGGGTAVVGGAGLSGVQTAGELAAFAREKDAAVDVVLLEQRETVAPSFPEQFRDAVRDELDREDVEVRTGVTVSRARAEAIETDDGDVAYDVFVWTGGIRGPDAVGGERVNVRADFAVDDHTLVLGDAARVVDAEGTAVPASAQAAVREAKVAARNVEEVVADLREHDDGFRPRLERYTFDSPGWLVSVGDGAVAQVGPSVFRGAAANAVKSGVGASYLASAGSIRDAVGLLREEFDLAGE
ncbi:NAD(P)/FAD-dependent oxidoreductase [Halobacterium sp. KA-6]|jgi:NADH dehydrogenase|uniref:NAD(P)/FAD-dependent oxidoreductase n=1 Tax=Halobacterium sp. KA-6 TaxID=2896368 RepID=UPI001E2EC01A|nr:FAD-dependent oxidoreductase [Halobacterium sp. KA-6]MCD2202273.1 FAD-dependent oxidoreductase [Halobacterium sp. KA-6]